MSKIRTLLLLILITAATTLSASVLPNDQHWVTVISKNSGQPVEGVSITVNNSYIATTGPLGRVLISDLHEGDVVSFFHTSYAPRHYNFKQLKRANFKVGLYESVLNIQEVVIKANRSRLQAQPARSKNHQRQAHEQSIHWEQRRCP